MENLLRMRIRVCILYLAVASLKTAASGAEVSNVVTKYSQNAPHPIEMAPAISSATPPRITTLEFPSPARPAVRANGTVKPSDRPMTL
jgi:hypothetical protein